MTGVHIALGLAVVAIVTTVTFQASLQRLVDTPARYGLTSDLTIVDAREPDVAELVADRRVAALDVVTTVPVTFGDDAGPLPDALIHAFRAHVTGGEPSVNAPAMICRLGWYAPGEVPAPHTATLTAVLADVTAGRRGVVADVRRDAELLAAVPADAATPLPA